MGQPSRGYTRLPISESIGYVEGTWGTETSKYPQEKRETSIPRVAASETGWAKTFLTFASHLVVNIYYLLILSNQFPAVELALTRSDSPRCKIDYLREQING